MTNSTDSTDSTGSLGDEAARLLGAMQDWARRTIPDDHLATGAPECAWCPFCQLVRVLRGDRPEVSDRLTEAGAAIVTALRALLDAPTEERPSYPHVRRVQHIDLSPDD